LERGFTLKVSTRRLGLKVSTRRLGLKVLPEGIKGVRLKWSGVQIKPRPLKPNRTFEPVP
jgi:hypothetical protein